MFIPSLTHQQFRIYDAEVSWYLVWHPPHQHLRHKRREYKRDACRQGSDTITPGQPRLTAGEARLSQKQQHGENKQGVLQKVGLGMRHCS